MNNKILITGCNGSIGYQLVLKALSKKYEVYGHTTQEYIPMIKTENILFGNFLDNTFFNNFYSFIYNNDIHCIINNAGVYSNEKLTDLSNNSIEKIIKINMISPMIITTSFAKYMENINNTGILININSIAAKYPSYLEPIYCASKSGLDMFMNSISMDKDNTLSIINCYFGAIQSRMTINRLDYSKLINPLEVAEIVINMLENNVSQKTGQIVNFEYRKKHR